MFVRYCSCCCHCIHAAATTAAAYIVLIQVTVIGIQKALQTCNAGGGGLSCGVERDIVVDDYGGDDDYDDDDANDVDDDIFVHNFSAVCMSQAMQRCRESVMVAAEDEEFTVQGRAMRVGVMSNASSSSI
jgi:hypothetical protein